MADNNDSLLKIYNSPVLQQFLHECVDDLTGLKQASFDNYNSDIEWTVDDFNSAKKQIQKVCRECIAQDKLEIDTNLPENVQQEIKKCLEIRKDDIYQFLIKEQLINSGHNLVENIDWRLKWILGNSTLASVREPLLQVDLHCIKNATSSDKLDKNLINFEVNLETLDSLIDQLQKVSKELENNDQNNK